MEREWINVVVISHEYGTTIFASRDPKKTDEGLLNYVNEYWDDVIDEEDMKDRGEEIPPKDSMDRVYMYFDWCDHEWYAYESVALDQTDV